MACPWESVSSAKSVECLESRPIPHTDLQTIFFPWKLDLGYRRSTQFRSLLDEQISFQSLGLIPSVMAQWFSPCSGFKPSGIHKWKPCQHSATELDLGCQWLVGWVGPWAGLLLCFKKNVWVCFLIGCWALSSWVLGAHGIFFVIAGLARCGKSCRLRWINYLRPDIKRGKISSDEDDLIITLHALLGNRYKLA
jgi:hypothetical protein